MIKEAQTELEDRLEKVSKTVEALAIDAMALCFISQLLFAVIFILF